MIPFMRWTIIIYLTMNPILIKWTVGQYVNAVLLDKGTPEENKAVVLGSSVHYGTYTVNEKEGFFSVLPEAATFPNWVGIEQKRFFSISEGELKITNPSGSTGGVSILILKRTK